MKGWSFLRANNMPKHLGGNHPPVHQSILTAVDRIGLDFDFLSDHRVKTFYRILLDWQGGLPCIGAWERELSLSLRTTNLWKNIYGGLCTYRESDIAWTIANRVVKTRAFLHGWQRLNVPEHCAICGSPETIQHVFHDCTNASPVWRWISPLINKVYNRTIPLTKPIILLGHGLPNSPPDRPAYYLSLCILRISLNEIWAARNKSTFDRKTDAPDNIIKRISARLRHRLLAAFHLTHRSDFIKAWAIQGALLSISNDSLQFTF